MLLELKKVEETKASVWLVLAEHVPFLWGQVWPLIIETESELGEIYEQQELLTCLLSGTCLLWVAVDKGRVDGCLVTYFETRRKMKILVVSGIAGKPKKFRSYFKAGLEMLEKTACMMECDYIRLEGRRAWQRLLRERGYRESAIQLSKPVKVLWSN